MNLRLHHVGIAVRDITKATEDYQRRLGCEPEGGVHHDLIQTAFIQFLRLPGNAVLIELVAPDGPESRLQGAVKRGAGLNHLCYETEDIEATCKSLRDDGWVIIHEPTPAVGFGGRRIAWALAENHVLTELVENEPATHKASEPH